VTLGLAVSLGGGLSPALGAIADHFGVAAPLLTISALALAALLIGATLPGETRRTSRPSEAVLTT